MVHVIGWAAGILVGAALGTAIVWMVRAPFRAGRYVARSVRAHDARNRQVLGEPPADGHRSPGGFSGTDRDLLHSADEAVSELKRQGRRRT